jgi:predicted TIM-barrel fold metal-dependent hydrolase
MVIDSHQHFWIFDEERDSWITPDMQVIRRKLPAGGFVAGFES